MIEIDKTIFSLRDLLLTPEVLPPEGVSVFVNSGGLNLDTECAILTDEDYDEAGNDFNTAVISGLIMTDFLPVDAFEQVIENARLQRNPLTPELLLTAMSFYFQNDAFIDFDINEV